MDKAITLFVLSAFLVFDGFCSKIEQYPEQKILISKEILIKKLEPLGLKESKIEEILESVLKEAKFSNEVIEEKGSKTSVTSRGKKYSIIGSVAQLLFKEPVRLIQFFIKTDRLKQKYYEIPVGFMVATIIRFVGATGVDLCIGAGIVNDFLKEPFLKGLPGWICGGIFIVAECLHYGGRTVVRSMYSDVSSLYGENGDNYSDTARTEL